MTFPAGGGQCLACDAQTFNHCLLDIGLVDLSFCGQAYTWKRRNLRSRLDKVVGNGAWSSKYREAVIRHLPKLKSDHIPLLLDFNVINLVESNAKPFRFLAPWLIHDGFKQLLQEV